MSKLKILCLIYIMFMLLSTYASVPSFITFQASPMFCTSLCREKESFPPFLYSAATPEPQLSTEVSHREMCHDQKSGICQPLPSSCPARVSALCMDGEMVFSRSRADSGVALAVGWQHRRVHHRALSSRAVPTVGPTSRCRLPEPRGAPTPAPARRGSPTGRAPTGLGSGRRCRPAPMATAPVPRAGGGSRAPRPPCPPWPSPPPHGRCPAPRPAPQRCRRPSAPHAAAGSGAREPRTAEAAR